MLKVGQSDVGCPYTTLGLQHDRMKLAAAQLVTWQQVNRCSLTFKTGIPCKEHGEEIELTATDFYQVKIISTSQRAHQVLKVR